jgi:phospholipase/carboxylesterase
VSLVVRERPPAGDGVGALVVIHGRGANEHDLFPLIDVLDPGRRLHGYAPRGPLALPPGGAHWYAVPRVGHPDPATFNASYATLGEWVDALPYERVVLAGFSQGAVMALALGLGSRRPRPAALAAFSGFIPVVDGWAPDLTSPLPPITIGHGEYDPIIPVTFGRAARDLLERAGADLEYRESPIDHSIDPATLALARDRIAAAT